MIKTTATNIDKEHFTKYPYLGIFKDGMKYRIVLFSGISTGTLVDQTDGFDSDVVGLHQNNWAENLFKPFGGTLTMSNP